MRALAAAFLLQAALPGAFASGGGTAGVDQQWEWTGVSRVVAVGDLHGNHDKLVRLLTAADLIDDELRWCGGDNHLVVAGDFLDRGLDDRRLMDLLRRLQQESAAAGGRVHVLLGNHEVMNLFRDLRYVNPASYRDFAPEEGKPERKAAAGKYARLQGVDWGSDMFRRFNKKFPPGFFARQRSFDPDGSYGSWLMGLPTIVRIDGIAYTHGGLNEEFAALGIEGINRRITAQLRRYLEARTALETENVVSSVMGTLEILGEAEKAAKKRRGVRATIQQQAAEELLAAANDPILGEQGPLWYRGNSLQDERLERDILDRSLELLGADALVVAHSPTMAHRITSRFHGRLFRIDHGIGESDTPLALIAEQGETLVLDSVTRETTTPMREFPLGQLGASRKVELGDDALGEFLSNSPVIAARTLGRGSTRPQLVVLENQGDVRRGIFKAVENDTGTDRYQHEVAAYRIDRALGLGMVPVTVVRTLGDKTGSPQAWVDGALDQETAEGYNLPFFDTEGKSSQLARGAVFDALIGNTSRKPADILGLVRQEKVLLIDHSKAFSVSTDLPEELDRVASTAAPLVGALETLDRAFVDSELGELLTEAQIEALLERRDRILARLRAAVTEAP